MNNFPLFNSACDLAQHFWKELLVPGDSVIDATLGNGHDILFLSKIILPHEKGIIFGFDIQETAIKNTKQKLGAEFSVKELERVVLFHESHDRMEKLIHEPIKLIVYNLGYLPGSDKMLTTKTETTLDSIKQGMNLLSSGGALSIVCYPGHLEGEAEEKLLVEFFSKADPALWSITHFKTLNRQKSPNVLLVQKKY